MNAVDRSDERQNLQSYEEQRHLKQRSIFYLVNIVWESNTTLHLMRKKQGPWTRDLSKDGAAKSSTRCQTADLLVLKIEWRRECGKKVNGGRV